MDQDLKSMYREQLLEEVRARDAPRSSEPRGR
ncbi:hypothetical protein BH24GEM1_BH24GEM1_13230 [soil metagenome]